MKYSTEYYVLGNVAYSMLLMELLDGPSDKAAQASPHLPDRPAILFDAEPPI